MGLFNIKKRIAGLDIGDHSIKLAEIKKSGQGYELVNFAVLPTPREAKVGETFNDPLALAPVLNNLIDMYNGKMPKVALCLSGNSVLIRHFILPEMPDYEMAEAIKFEVEANLPIPLAELVVDFIRVGEVGEGSVKKVEVMVVAARNEIINRFVDAVKATGIEPVGVDIEPLALLRTVQLAENVDDIGNFAIVNIGSGNTDISIFDNTVLRFTRTIATGGNKISGTVSSQSGLNFAEAAAAGEDINFDRAAEMAGLSEETKAELLRPVLNELFMEINRTIEFYQAKFRGASIRKVFFCGGFASLKGLCEMAAAQLGVETSLINPIKELAISAKLASEKDKIEAAGSTMSVAVGLALSEVN